MTPKAIEPDPTIDSEALREQLEEFALHMKPGTTKGKHRTAIFDTLELTKLVQHLIAQEATAARLDELKNLEKTLFPNYSTSDERDVKPYIQDRISRLTADKEQAALQNKTNDGVPE